MLASFFYLSTDTSSVDIRAIVSQDIDRAAYHNLADGAGGFAQRLFGSSEIVLLVELGLLLAMAVLFVLLVFRYRKLARNQKIILAAEQRMGLKRPPQISKIDIERILSQIATEKVRRAESAASDYILDYNAGLNSPAVIHEMARTQGLESERLNFAISYASQKAKHAGVKFKEAFSLVSEDTDLNVLARQLNMGRGELELILALKRSKIANSKRVKDERKTR